MIQQGDVVECPPGVAHWHGATHDSEFTHIAVGPNRDEGEVIWLEKVTHKEYKRAASGTLK